jgi:hypothetical protein
MRALLYAITLRTDLPAICKEFLSISANPAVSCKRVDPRSAVSEKRFGNWTLGRKYWKDRASNRPTRSPGIRARTAYSMVLSRIYHLLYARVW